MSFRRLPLCLALLALAGCASNRAEMKPEELRSHSARAIAANTAVVGKVERTFTATLEAELAAGHQPSIDILSLSGGADWGAFGTGFLLGWSKRPAGDPLAMPRFDLVTGISTGALIAPYAAIGKYQQVDDLFRDSTPDWAEARFLSSMFSGHSLYDISKLEDAIYHNLDQTVIPGLLDPLAPPRNVVIATTDMDLGILRVWDLAEVARDRARLQAVERAAIAIPAAFDPVFIDGTLQADAGVMQQLISVAQPERIAAFMRAWNQAHPDHPMRMRYWVVANNRTAEPPTTVQTTWHALLGRSTAMMMKSGVVAPLTALWLQTELLRRDGLDVEFRWIAIPTDFPIDESISPFDNRITRSLSDLGRTTAAKPDPWQRLPPLPIQRPDGN